MYRKLYIFVLILIIVVTVLLNCWWIVSDKGEMHRAESFKFFVADSYYSPNPNSVALNFYPPGYFFLPTVFSRLLHFNFKYDLCVFLNIVYFVLSLVGVYFLVSYVLKQESYAALACLLLTAFPLFLYTSKRFFMEVGLMPWVIFAVYLILINDNWGNYRKAFLLGIISGIGMLFKWTFLLYVFGPIVVSLLYSLNNKGKDKKNILKAFGITLVTTALVCGLWYTLRFSFAELLFNFKGAWDAATNIKESYWSFLRYNLWRSGRFLAQGISYPFLVISCLSIFVTFNQIRKDRKLHILIVWFIFPFVILWAFTGDSEPRYLLPILPFFAVLLVIFLNKLNIKLQRYIVIGVIGLCLWNIFYETFVYRPPLSAKHKTLTPVIQMLLSGISGKRPLYIGFNGIYDFMNTDEVFDTFVMFWAYKVNEDLPFCTRYFKEEKDLKNIWNCDYIISQQIDANQHLHREFLDKGYKKMFEYKHYYRENSDPKCDWISNPNYIVFKKN